MNQKNMLESKPSSDPWAVLGITTDAGDEQIRVAYVRKIKEFPPDRNPMEFELIRDAYELLRDRRQRARHFLFSVDPRAPLSSMIEHGPRKRKYVGLGPWLAVLKEK
jgi:curved DNA-binding protein CbpA